MGQSEYSMRKPAYLAGKFVYSIEKSVYIYFWESCIFYGKAGKICKKVCIFQGKV